MSLKQKTDLLRECLQAHRHEFHQDFNLRIHRALSWLDKAASCENDDDTAFISLWIAFNAAYANEFGGQINDKQTFQEFLFQVCHLDESEKRIYDLIWNRFSGSIRLLLDNRYVYQAFWDYHNGNITQSEWESKFIRAKDAAYHSLKDQNTVQMLSVIFNLLYTLRNQIIHGGATYNSKANRKQLKDGRNILEMLIPMIIEIMLEHAEKFNGWGKPFYPYIQED